MDSVPRLPIFRFKEPVLGHHTADPDSWMQDANGVSLTLPYERHPMGNLGFGVQTAQVTVFVPWSNIAYKIEEQAWD